MPEYRTLIIDPFAKTVREEYYDLSEPGKIGQLLLAEQHRGRVDPGGSEITSRLMCAGPTLLRSDFDGTITTVWLDDEGLFRRDQAFFKISGVRDPLAGIGLVVSTNQQGETTSVPHYITRRALLSLLTWHTREEIAKDVAPTTISTGFGDNAVEVASFPVDILDPNQWSE